MIKIFKLVGNKVIRGEVQKNLTKTRDSDEEDVKPTRNER